MPSYMSQLISCAKRVIDFVLEIFKTLQSGVMDELVMHDSVPHRRQVTKGLANTLPLKAVQFSAYFCDKFCQVRGATVREKRIQVNRHAVT